MTRIGIWSIQNIYEKRKTVKKRYVIAMVIVIAGLDYVMENS